jgi:hypothetical protein
LRVFTRRTREARRQWNHADIDYGTGDCSDVGQHRIEEAVLVDASGVAAAGHATDRETAGMVRFHRAVSRNGSQEDCGAGYRAIAVIEDDAGERPGAIAGICRGNRRREERGQQLNAGQHVCCAPATSNVAPNLLLAFPREDEQCIVV